MHTGETCCRDDEDDIIAFGGYNQRTGQLKLSRRYRDSFTTVVIVNVCDVKRSNEASSLADLGLAVPRAAVEV